MPGGPAVAPGDQAPLPQPVLRTDRLLLIPLADRHLDLEVALDADPEVMRHLTGRPHSRGEVVASHARRMGLAAGPDGLGYWVAFGSAGGVRGSTAPPGEDAGEFVGLLMLPPAHGPDPAVAELGYRLVRRHWGQGLASEASRVLLRHAFGAARQSRVIARTMAVNTNSRRVLEAVGMRHARTFFPHWDDPLPGADQGEVEYDLTRESWAAAR